MEYSNPRREAVIQDWPYGRLRTQCTFSIETKGRKQRAVRTTINPKNGRENKPKKSTYSLGVMFVDGSDDRIYIVQDTGYCFHITRSNMMFEEETVYEDTNNDQYKKILNLFSNLPETDHNAEMQTNKIASLVEVYRGIYEQDGAEVLELTAKIHLSDRDAETVINIILEK